MAWTFAILAAILVYVAIPSGAKVNVVCGSVDSLMEFGGWGLNKAAEIGGEMNMQTQGIVDQGEIGLYATKAGVACREKMRRFVVYTDGLNASRFTSDITQAGNTAIQEGSKAVRDIQQR